MKSNPFFQCLAGLYFLLVLVTSLPAQVVYNNNAQCIGSDVSNSSTLSLPNFIVPANNNAVLVVLVRGSAAMTVSSMTFNTQSLTRLGSVVSYFNARSEIWYLALGNLAVPVTSNIDVVWTGNNDYRMMTALSAHNVNQTTPLNNLTSNGFPINATSSSITVSGASGDLAVEAISSIGNLTNPPVFTPTSGQTEFQSCTSSRRAVSGNLLLTRLKRAVPPWVGPSVVFLPLPTTGFKLVLISDQTAHYQCAP